MKFQTATKLALFGASLDLVMFFTYRILDLSNADIRQALAIVQFAPRVTYFLFFLTLYRKQMNQSPTAPSIGAQP